MGAKEATGQLFGPASRGRDHWIRVFNGRAKWEVMSAGSTPDGRATTIPIRGGREIGPPLFYRILQTIGDRRGALRSIAIDRAYFNSPSNSMYIRRMSSGRFCAQRVQYWNMPSSVTRVADSSGTLESCRRFPSETTFSTAIR